VADLVVTCRRDGECCASARRDLDAVAALLTPPGVAMRAPKLVTADGVAAAVLNPSLDGSEACERGVRVGVFTGVTPDWCRPGAPTPDGTYVMARWDDGTLEVLNDVIGSRTAWYVMDDEQLLVSTSQRALAALLHGVTVDPRATAWFLSSGTLGPLGAWDSRVRTLPPDARLSVDRTAWRATVVQRPAVFAPVRRSRRAHVDALGEAIDASCAGLGISHERWLLPLSGGLDSRTILLALRACDAHPRAVTWTTRRSLRDPLSDARVADLVAWRFGVDHRHIVVDHPEEPDPSALDAFVAAGEGRTHEFAAYVDGLAMWRGLVADGVDGVIRGDESCGLRKRNVSDAASRRAAGGTVVSDYPAGHLIHALGLAEQPLPDWLERRSDETAEAYCDRADQQMYHPNVLAPLNAIKGRYVEIANPLLTRQVIDVVRALPDDLRIRARALYAVVSRRARGLPFARAGSLVPAGEYLARADLVEEVVRCLTSADAATLITEEGALRILAGMAHEGARRPSLGAHVKSALRAGRTVLPKRAADRLSPRYDGPDALSAVDLGFRVTVAAKTIALLRRDAMTLAQGRRDSA
jgi:hypothetical protein